MEQRASSIRAALRDAGASGAAELPAVLIENSSRCDTNGAGQQVLPNDQAWLPALMTSVRAYLLSSCNLLPPRHAVSNKGAVTPRRCETTEHLSYPSELFYQSGLPFEAKYFPSTKLCETASLPLSARMQQLRRRHPQCAASTQQQSEPHVMAPGRGDGVEAGAAVRAGREGAAEGGPEQAVALGDPLRHRRPGRPQGGATRRCGSA